MHGTADTLTLDGTFGQAALIQDLEASFGILLPPPEAQAWYFVGDIYRSLIARLGPSAEGGRANAGILAFYYLRRGVRELGYQSPFTPDTRLAEIERFHPRRFLKRLAEATGLRLPDHDGSRLGWMAIAACLAAAAGFAFGIGPLPVHWPFAMLAVSVAFFLPMFDPGRFPADCRTARQLAERAAALNYAKLRGDGAAGDEAAIWKALVLLLSEHAAGPVPEITPHTRLVSEETAAGKIAVI